MSDKCPKCGAGLQPGQECRGLPPRWTYGSSFYASGCVAEHKRCLRRQLTQAEKAYADLDIVRGVVQDELDEVYGKFRKLQNVNTALAGSHATMETDLAQANAKLDPPFDHSSKCEGPAMDVVCLNCEQVKYDRWFTELNKANKARAALDGLLSAVVQSVEELGEAAEAAREAAPDGPATAQNAPRINDREE
ncbi:hypothetical protein LCGC14_1051400 [marine sediment metagenome]|uniref:Uncharacterized protein n=1 Tax=marine sediment metagenome TaxID=412755 RepID=A0A0F9Q6U9_9ZZZZ